MFALQRFGIKLGLETITDILDGLGNPHRNYRCIHVAGTNGKGSIASGLTAALRCAGYKTGLYTSPHLVRFNERIAINGVPITDERVVAGYQAVKAVHGGDREPTFFEFATAMALWEFAAQKVDWAVIETGMGGRLDATNVLTPALSVITNISVEHGEYLGNTIARVAYEKAGIIKPGVPAVTGVTQKSAISALEKKAAEENAPLFRLGKDFRIRRSRTGFTYHGMDHTWKQMETSLLGRFQAENAAIVAAASEVLIRSGAADISEADIRRGLIENRWPGRLEVVSQQPLLILDGAHNLAAARELGRYMATDLAGRRITLVVGILDDKPYRAMLDHLIPACARVVLTQPVIGRALSAQTLRAAIAPTCHDITVIPKVAEAVRHAIETSGPDDVVVVAGSLYVVGEAKETLAAFG
ncbi:MAG: bifunctional folylpolyglutamate synthase/dihydrofolate synthase [Desulfobacterales bacterium]|nr:bifunctional folylpolyglutamate synthase/dihydrofolate synthase [Desulfobacterales bacterium]